MTATPNTPQGSQPISDIPESIFENVVAEKYPDAYEASQIPEEVPSEVTSATDVDRPAAEVLDQVPEMQSDDGKIKYFFIGIIVLVFIGIFVALITIFRKSTPQQVAVVPVTLTYWGLWEDETILKPVFDAYTLANPHVKISYVKQSSKDYISFIKGRSKSGKGPDIFRYHNTWLPELTNDDIYVQPIPDSIMTPAEFEKTFHLIHQQDLKKGNAYFGIPLYVDNLVMVYNKDILKAGGVAGPPRQWIGDLEDVVSKVTVKNDTDVPVTSGIALGTANNVEHFSDIYAVLLLLNNLTSQSLLSNEWALSVLRNLSTPSGADLGSEALQVYRQFGEEKIWSSKMPNSIDAFAQGKVAIIFAYTWQIPLIKSKNPDINLAVAPLPEGLQGKKLTLASYWVEGVSPYAKAANQAEAWKLLKYMSSAASEQKIYEAQTKTRGLGMAYSRVDMKSKLSDHPILSTVISQLDQSVSLPLVTRTFDKGLNDEMITYLQTAIDSTSNGVSYSGAMSTAITGFTQTLTKYKVLQ
ncbi:MAG: extracellular solute-binding protein [Candidatus Roizmanbacteria bacterium]